MSLQPNPSTTTVIFTCRMCGKKIKVTVNIDDLDKFQRGEGHIQDIFPYLTSDEREMFLSQICGDCFRKIFDEE